MCRNAAAVVVVCGSLLVSVAWADIIPPGYKSIEHLVEFENLGDFPDYAFYVYPRDLAREQEGNSSVLLGPDASADISRLNPLAVGQSGGVFLFAIPKSLAGAGDQPPKEEWFTADAPGVFKSRLADQRRNAPLHGSDRVVNRYRVAGLPQSLSVTEVPIEGSSDDPSRDSGTSPLLPGYAMWFLAALPVAAALWIVLRRKGRKAPTSHDAAPR